MGIAQADTMEIDGTHSLPDDDPDETPPGRAPVSYTTAGDGLFSPLTPAAGDVEPDAAALSGLMGMLHGSLGDPSGGIGGGTAALIAQLESMADEFERQSGEEETEIVSGFKDEV